MTGHDIRARRLAAGVSQREVADYLGIDRSSVSAVERTAGKVRSSTSIAYLSAINLIAGAKMQQSADAAVQVFALGRKVVDLVAAEVAAIEA